MNSFDFYSPTYFVFGRDRENDTGKYVAKFGGSRVLIVYGGQSAKRSGLLDRVKASVNAAGLYSIELGGVKSNPKSGFVYEGIELGKKLGADFLLAVGRFRHVGRQQSGLVIQLQKDCLVCIGLYRYQGIGESHGIIIIVVQA